MAPEARSYSGPLVFVNHNPRTRDKTLHKHNVFKHIQKNYAKWKRGEGIQMQHVQPDSLPEQAIGVSRETYPAISDHCNWTIQENDTSEEQSSRPGPRLNHHVRCRRSQADFEARTGPATLSWNHASDPSSDFNLISPTSINSSIQRLRVDCIEAYPVKHLPRLSQAMEFYMYTMGPTGIWRPDILDAGATAVFKREFFQASISTPAITEVIMAIAQVHIRQFSAGGTQDSYLILQHRGNAIRGLQNALSDLAHRSNDAALILILSLLILDSNFEDWVSYEANLKGLRQFVKLQGGLGCLGWHGWAAWMTMWAETRWLGHLTQLAIIESTTYGLKPSVYPSHISLHRERCFDISKLPEGFTRLAISSCLSVDMIQHLQDISQWSREFRACMKAPGDMKEFSIREMQLANQIYTVLQTHQLKPLERLVCIGTLAFIISFDANVPLERHPQYLKHCVPGISQLFSELPTAQQTDDVLLWVATCIAAINTRIVELPLEDQWFLLDHFLDQYWELGDFETVWRAVWRSIAMFNYDEDLEDKWENCWRARWDVKRSVDVDISQCA